MKRIVICADGTWNQPERVKKTTGRFQPTNVLKTARGVLPRDSTGDIDIEQVVYYHPGVGTGWGADRITGGMFGHGLLRNVRSLYRFIVLNYMPGDEIYLFGFSRGAFTVRVLTGFMKCVGLVRKDDEYYTPQLFTLYEKGVKPGSPEWEEAHQRIEGVRPCPPIKFVGVWDTVGAMGAPGLMGQVFNRGAYKHLNVGLIDDVENVAHACSIDEHRGPFALTPFAPAPAGWSGELHEAWFAGPHGDVGGGYSPDSSANIAMHWVLEHAGNCGLKCDYEDYLAHYKCYSKSSGRWYQQQLNDSMSFLFRLRQRQRDLSITGMPVILHDSVLERIRDKNHLPDNLKAVYANGQYEEVTTQRKL